MSYLAFAALLLLLAAAGGSAVEASSAAAGYSAAIVHFDDRPVVSSVDGSADFQQVFNPSWVVASPGTGGKAGLLIR